MFGLDYSFFELFQTVNDCPIDNSIYFHKENNNWLSYRDAQAIGIGNR